MVLSEPDEILRIFEKMWEKSNFPTMIFSYSITLFKIVCRQNVFNCQPILGIFIAHFMTNYVLNFAKKIVFYI